jgi:hypothetical protein
LSGGIAQDPDRPPASPDPNGRKDRLALVVPIVIGLGHEVIAHEIEVEDLGAMTAR